MIGSLELLDGSLMDKSVVRSFTTTQKVEMEVKDVVGSNRDKVVHAFTKHKMSAKAKAYVEWDKEGLATASSLGLTNPAFVIWDMIPYSHVIDWGIGVGNYLNNLDALAGVKRVSAHYTVKNHAYREILSVWGGKGTGYRMVTSRSILNITAPRLTVGPGVNAFRGLQALAMARQLL